MFIQTASGTLDKVHASKDNKEKGTMALVKATIVLCSGGYAGLIFGFLGGIFYIYKDAASLPHTATGLYNHQNTHLS